MLFREKDIMCIYSQLLGSKYIAITRNVQMFNPLSDVHILSRRPNSFKFTCLTKLYQTYITRQHQAAR